MFRLLNVIRGCFCFILCAKSANTNVCIEKLDYDCGLLTSCQSGSSCSWGHCYCTSGTCAGLDDRCHQGQYQRLEGTYRISNVRWPEYYAYMKTLGGSGIKKDASGEESEFHISVVHAPAGGGLAILVVSKKWPDWALTMVKHKVGDTKSYSFHSQKIDNDAEVEDTATLLYQTPVSENPWASNASMVMLRGVQQDEFAYVPRGSWSISGDEDDKGTGMYWYISPPLPATLLIKMHAYTGSRCSVDCGNVGSFSGFQVDATRRLSVSSFTIVLFLILLGPK